MTTKELLRQQIKELENRLAELESFESNRQAVLDQIRRSWIYRLRSKVRRD